MCKGGRLRCKNSGAVERQLGRQLAPYSKERRSFLCSVATAGAGWAGSAILSLSAEAQRKPEASPKAFAATSCGNGRVIAALRAAPAYSYIYAWRTPVLNGRPGSFHASEIAFTFDNAEICDHYSCGVP